MPLTQGTFQIENKGDATIVVDVQTPCGTQLTSADRSGLTEARVGWIVRLGFCLQDVGVRSNLRRRFELITLYETKC
jgi:hypothetical protein